MNSVAAIIDAFGGPTQFAAVIGKRVSTASEMKRAGSIAVRYWPAIVSAATARGLRITNDVLVAAHVSNGTADVPRPSRAPGADGAPPDATEDELLRAPSVASPCSGDAA